VEDEYIESFVSCQGHFSWVFVYPVEWEPWGPHRRSGAKNVDILLSPRIPSTLVSWTSASLRLVPPHALEQDCFHVSQHGQ